MKNKSGRLEVICGPMFSGKSEELIRRAKRAQIAGRPFKVFKPDIDNRYSLDHVAAHSGVKLQCTPVKGAQDIKLALEGQPAQLIGIDECQFLEDEITGIIEDLVERGFRVIVAGLDVDSNKIPFAPMPYLMAIAERVDKLTAVCSVCGEAATLTFRKVVNPADEQVFVGADNMYEARCRAHWGWIYRK